MHPLLIPSACPTVSQAAAALHMRKKVEAVRGAFHRGSDWLLSRLMQARPYLAELRQTSRDSVTKRTEVNFIP